jgi:hypothetical protein
MKELNRILCGKLKLKTLGGKENLSFTIFIGADDSSCTENAAYKIVRIIVVVRRNI